MTAGQPHTCKDPKNGTKVIMFYGKKPKAREFESLSPSPRAPQHRKTKRGTGQQDPRRHTDVSEAKPRGR